MSSSVSRSPRLSPRLCPGCGGLRFRPARSEPGDLPVRADSKHFKDEPVHHFVGTRPRSVPHGRRDRLIPEDAGARKVENVSRGRWRFFLADLTASRPAPHTAASRRGRPTRTAHPLRGQSRAAAPLVRRQHPEGAAVRRGWGIILTGARAAPPPPRRTPSPYHHRLLDQTCLPAADAASETARSYLHVVMSTASRLVLEDPLGVVRGVLGAALCW